MYISSRANRPKLHCSVIETVLRIFAERKNAERKNAERKNAENRNTEKMPNEKMPNEKMQKCRNAETHECRNVGM
jgi:hypothetical protein